MSVCDPYRELELYLEQAHHDICQVFEPRNVPVEGEEDKASAVASTNNNAPNVDCKWDADVLVTRIASDIKELMNRHAKQQLDLEPELTRSLSESFLPPTNLTSWTEHSTSLACLTGADHAAANGDDSVSLISFTDADCGVPLWHHQELATKSSSAPALKKVVLRVNKQARRSQSDRHLSEIEATEACKWLRATGFPQYAQMYDNQQFPVDVIAAEHDHPLLEASVLHSLFRRLQALNRCARVVHQHQRGGGGGATAASNTATAQHSTDDDDSEDEEQCALSDNWTYQSDLRRWSRNNITTSQQPPPTPPPRPAAVAAKTSDVLFRKASDELATSLGRLRRAASSTTSKYRRRNNRDGLIMNDASSGGSDNEVNYGVLELLSRQLENLNTNHHHTNAATGSSQQPPPPTPAAPIINKQTQGRPVASLSCTQLQVLRKLALLKLTAHMEKYCPTHRSGWNWDLPKLIRRKMKGPAYRDKCVFGVPLTIILQRSGSSMPRGIEEALQWLQQTAYDQVGLFRKSGVKSRIHNVKMMVENSQGLDGYLNFSEHQAYDIADMVKQYFRELPEALLTNKLSETFILIFQYVPEEERRQAVLCALLLMPDEHCEVLQCLLHFLTSIAEHASVNQMTDSNLAVCFAPSLFHYNQMVGASVNARNHHPIGSPHPRELAENKAAQDCLLYLLRNCGTIFSVTDDLLKQCTYNNESCAVQLAELGGAGNWSVYLSECQNMLLREVREKGWIPVVIWASTGVDLAYKKVADGHPLRLWKVNAEIEAPPTEVLYRILRERSKWDEDLHSTRTVAQLRQCAEVFQFARRNIAPLPLEDYCVVRNWWTATGRCVIIETSVEHPDATSIPRSVRGIVLASRYLIEPCGSGRSRLVHMSRVDTRGRMPEWYHKNYGHLCALHVANIQTSFRANLAVSGPESKV